MLYQPPFVPGATPGVTGIFNADPDAGYVNGDPSTGTEGSYFSNAALEHPQRELVKLLTSLGITPSHAVLEQVAEAVSRGASLGVWGTFGGTENAITVTKSGSVVVPKTLFTGMRVRGRPSATNTSATTANVFTLGSKKVLTWSGAALVGDEIKISRDTEWEYDATLDAGAGAWRVMPWTQMGGHTRTLYLTSTQTVTLTADETRARVQVWGAGGGGGGSAGTANSIAAAGGGGGYAESFLTGLSGSYTATVGAGGAGGAGGGSPVAGGAGGTSSVMGLSATGGVGGFAANGAIQLGAGAGGAGSSGNLVNLSGGGGGVGYAVSTSFIMAQGGISHGSAHTGTVATAVGTAGRSGIFPGGGASGGALSGNGGAGAGGLIIIELYN